MALRLKSLSKSTQMEGAMQQARTKKVSRLLTFGLLALSWVIWLQPWNNKNVGFAKKTLLKKNYLRSRQAWCQRQKVLGRLEEWHRLDLCVCHQYPVSARLCLSIIWQQRNRAHQWSISLNTSHTKSRKVEKSRTIPKKSSMICGLFWELVNWLSRVVAPAIHFNSRIVLG